MTPKRNKSMGSDALGSGGEEKPDGRSDGSTSSVAESLRRLGEPLPKLVAFDLE